jgi:hypothetical protein
MIFTPTWHIDAIKHTETTIYKYIWNAMSPHHTRIFTMYDMREDVVVVHIDFNDTIIGHIFVYEDFAASSEDIGNQAVRIVHNHIAYLFTGEENKYE